MFKLTDKEAVKLVWDEIMMEGEGSFIEEFQEKVIEVVKKIRCTK